MGNTLSSNIQKQRLLRDKEDAIATRGHAFYYSSTESDFPLVYGACFGSNPSLKLDLLMNGVEDDPALCRLENASDFDRSSSFIFQTLYSYNFIGSCLKSYNETCCFPPDPLSISHSRRRNNSNVMKNGEFLIERKVNHIPDWIHGLAGEDRVNVVVSEEGDWIFVGVYDGSRGHLVSEFLRFNIFPTICKEIESFFHPMKTIDSSTCSGKNKSEFSELGTFAEGIKATRKKWMKTGLSACGLEKCFIQDETDDKVQNAEDGKIDHDLVLNAMSRAFKVTGVTYSKWLQKKCKDPQFITDSSCVLVVMIKGEDIYVMNVGDSRAIIARYAETSDQNKNSEDVTKFVEESQASKNSQNILNAVQLSFCERIREPTNHPMDELLQARFDDETIVQRKIDCMGNARINLCHYVLHRNDKFLVISSSGLFKFFGSQEVVSIIETFVKMYPNGDPAKHLIEELLTRAATYTGTKLQELLDQTQLFRGKKHPDLTVIVISLEGKIWKSSKISSSKFQQ